MESVSCCTVRVRRRGLAGAMLWFSSSNSLPLPTRLSRSKYVNEQVRERERVCVCVCRYDGRELQAQVQVKTAWLDAKLPRSSTSPHPITTRLTTDKQATPRHTQTPGSPPQNTLLNTYHLNLARCLTQRVYPVPLPMCPPGQITPNCIAFSMTRYCRLKRLKRWKDVIGVVSDRILKSVPIAMGHRQGNERGFLSLGDSRQSWVHLTTKLPPPPSPL